MRSTGVRPEPLCAVNRCHRRPDAAGTANSARGATGDDLPDIGNPGHSVLSREKEQQIGRFAVDHLTVILNRHNQRVDFEVRVSPLSEQGGFALGG